MVLTELTAHVTNAVVDFVEEISEDFFPREDPDAYSEEQMVGDSITQRMVHLF